MRRPLWLGLGSALACALPAAARLAPGLLPLPLDPASQARAFYGLLAALGLAVVLALMLHQTRLAVFPLILAASTLIWRPENAPSTGQQAFWLWSLAVPLAAGLALGPPEGALASLRSAVRLLLAGLPFVVVLAFRSTDPLEFDRLLLWRPAGAPALALPTLALLPWSLAALMAWITWDRRLEDGLAAMAGALAGLLAVGWNGAAGDLATAWPELLGAHLLAAAALLTGVFFIYWGRVYLDELTGLPNRRALDERLQRLGGRYALAMVDIDHFKRFNDLYGHEEGDNVLRLVAKHLDAGTGGRAFRYGGEEFCAVFEGSDEGLAGPMMEQAREALASRSFSIRLPSKIRKKTSEEDRGAMAGRAVKVQVTVSVGVAGPDKAHRTPEQVIQWADQGLYKAKENGRNNVVRMQA